MKTLYFVRHGESTANAGEFAQGPDTPLSPEGERQIQFVAERFKTIAIDKILCSTYVRAKHTADAINAVLKKEIEYTDLIVERIRPSRLLNKLKTDPEFLEVTKAVEDNFHDPNFKFEDGETFQEMKDRALKLLAYVKDLPENNILLISHGIFMRMIFACVILGEEVTSQQYWRFYKNMKHGNTGITIIVSKENENGFRWRVKTWNDLAHLGEVDMRDGDTL